MINKYVWDKIPTATACYLSMFYVPITTKNLVGTPADYRPNPTSLSSAHFEDKHLKYTDVHFDHYHQNSERN